MAKTYKKIDNITIEVSKYDTLISLYDNMIKEAKKIVEEEIE